MLRRLLFSFPVVFASLAVPSSAAVFEIRGRESELAHLEELFRLHRVIGPDTTLWDPWVPMSVLWLETTNAPSTLSIRDTYRERLLRRRIDPEGYVSTQQHEGLAHGEGWPFPLWTQAGGVGWHFTTQGVPYGPGDKVLPTTSVTNWTLTGASTARLDPAQGWFLTLGGSSASVVSPTFRLDPFVSPFFRVKWSARGLGPRARVAFDWQIEGDADFPAGHRMEFSAPPPDGAVVDANIPVYRHPRWAGRIVRLRISLADANPGAELTLLRLFSACDSRHNINNAAYLQACDDYVRWTGDLDFLRQNLQRMRLALAWAIREFQLAEKGVVFTPWIGHEGRSGHLIDPNGRRTLRPGFGVGNNYWDLLPFGGEDMLATVYYFDVLRRMAALERQVGRHPEWNLPAGPLQFEPAELIALADTLREHGNERFWSETTARFGGWRDLDGRLHDYGFTFVNNEALYYGFVSENRARAIRDWMDGRRTVAGDTSTGADIYHWRFGPRATTRRNVETYLWAWSNPASIPWGGQVQDGGAVLGFAYHDLMARLEYNGPDDAWRRLRETIAWFADVREAGGYRAYYADKSRGTLQGGGTAGGLGLDHEFFESVLVPQVILYGFLGFRPRLDGCLISPRLPSDWPSLTVRGIRLHDVVLDVTATHDRLELDVHGQSARPLRLFTPGDDRAQIDIRDGRIEVTLGAPAPPAPNP